MLIFYSNYVEKKYLNAMKTNKKILPIDKIFM
jgi:hypothetical protein